MLFFTIVDYLCISMFVNVYVLFIFVDIYCVLCTCNNSVAKENVSVAMLR